MGPRRLQSGQPPPPRRPGLLLQLPLQRLLAHRAPPPPPPRIVPFAVAVGVLRPGRRLSAPAAAAGARVGARRGHGGTITAGHPVPMGTHGRLVYGRQVPRPAATQATTTPPPVTYHPCPGIRFRPGRFLSGTYPKKKCHEKPSCHPGLKTRGNCKIEPSLAMIWVDWRTSPKMPEINFFSGVAEPSLYWHLFVQNHISTFAFQGNALSSCVPVLSWGVQTFWSKAGRSERSFATDLANLVW